MSAFLTNKASDELNATVVAYLISMLDRLSSIEKAFWMARDWCHSHGSVNFELHLLSELKSTRQYNAPALSEVASLITNDFGDGEPVRDTVINSKREGPKIISELHPSYMALQYPLLFPYDEDGFHEEIHYHNNKGAWKTNRWIVTMKEYYANIILQRANQGNTLLKGQSLKACSSLVEQVVNQSYLDFEARKGDVNYLRERSILTPMNDDADKINNYMFKKRAV